MMWLNRLKETQNVKLIPKSGRPKKLNRQEKQLLINKIRNHPKLRFRKIRALGFRQIKVADGLMEFDRSTDTQIEMVLCYVMIYLF